MNTKVSERKPCPNCGKPMLPGVVEGLCPECLLGQAFATEDGEPQPRFKPPTIEQVQQLFPQLDVLSLLGAGGMGAVYKARQPVLGRFVALKILPGSQGGKFEERFNREARALARLNHPNIVAVYEFGQAGGLHYFIMEFVDGANLRQLEANRELSPREALQIVPQICDALQYAHDEGVVHRDIKPENVLVDRKGRVKIADFGLAKILEQSTDAHRLTAEGQVMGTPHYMAPEQVERPLAVDHRADIYSLGVVFYELLTGDLPLGNFQPPSRKVEVDVRLDEVVLRALANDPERRYQQANEVKSKVEDITNTPEQKVAEKQFLRWAGLPVVVQVGEERFVNWNGTLTALALALLSLVPGFLLARLVVTEQQISGASHLVTLTAFLLVMFGVRRTLVGELIRNRPWWRSQKLIFLFLPVFALCWSLFLAHLHEKAQRGITSAQKAEFLDNRLTANLPGRGVVQLVAVGIPGAGSKAWWNPQGNFISEHRYDVPNPTENSSSGLVSKDLLLKMSDLPNGASFVGLKSRPDSGAGSGGQVLKDGKPYAGAIQARLAWKPSIDKADIFAGFALENWQNIASISAKGDRAQHFYSPGQVYREVRFHHQPADTVEGAQVAIIIGPENPMWIHQVVAVDTNDVEVSANSAQGTPLGLVEEGFPVKQMRHQVTLWTYTFGKLPLEKIKEFRVQIRPVHWVKFPRVALKPRGKLPPQEAEQFTKSFHANLPDGTVIDFETGKLAEFPSAVLNEKNKSAATAPWVVAVGAGENVAWMVNNGFDAAGGINEIQPLGMDFVAYRDAEWDSIAPERLKKDVYGGYFRPSSLKPDTYKTFGFRTRDYSVGLLQFIESTNGLAFRYKLIIP